jgi:hypothetical protein
LFVTVLLTRGAQARDFARRELLEVLLYLQRNQSINT